MYRRMGQEHPVQSIPGESTIYRLLRKFTEEGLVRKSVDTQSRESFYVYASPPDQGEGLYMRCRVCGKLHPMESERCEQILRQIREQEHFTIDANTVLDGVCKNCQ
jgi:Fe2+ or Zn2+ uptake regulation protein